MDLKGAVISTLLAGIGIVVAIVVLNFTTEVEIPWWVVFFAVAVGVGSLRRRGRRDT